MDAIEEARGRFVNSYERKTHGRDMAAFRLGPHAALVYAGGPDTPLAQCIVLKMPSNQFAGRFFGIPLCVAMCARREKNMFAN